MTIIKNMQRVYTRGIVVSSCTIRVDEIIGHVPRELFIEVRHFLRHRGRSTCEVTGRRRCGNGLELPCSYHFVAKQWLIKKLEGLLQSQVTMLSFL